MGEFQFYQFMPDIADEHFVLHHPRPKAKKKQDNQVIIRNNARRITISVFLAIWRPGGISGVELAPKSDFKSGAGAQE